MFMQKITDMSLAEQKKLAKEIRVVIEPQGVRTNRILKECDLRKFLKRKNLAIEGISDVVTLLESNYSSVTIRRLMSKIQKSVVWDTCMCKLSLEELEKEFYNSEKNIIITTCMYDELIKLSESSKQNDNGVSNAKQIVLDIIQDYDSEFCTMVNLDKDNQYVDDVQLAFCVRNGYSLITYDFVMGLRARILNIDVKICNDLRASDVAQYKPAHNGPNVVLSADLLSNDISLSDIISLAEKIGANKFVLTYEFIELLEKSSIKSKYRDLIRFFVFDAEGKYSIYSTYPQSDMEFIVEEYGAIVFSSEIKTCINYKVRFIPYRIVYPSASTTAKTSINRNNTVPTTTQNSTNTTTSKTNKLMKNLEKGKSLNKGIPYYVPKSNCISFKAMPINEKIWVLDNTRHPQKPLNKKTISALPGFKIIHGINSLNNSYKLNVYEIVESNDGEKHGKLVFSENFRKENPEKIGKEYRHYAKLMTIMT